jgi:hypothetical protein
MRLSATKKPTAFRQWSFSENQHDQSSWSVLVKLNKVPFFSYNTELVSEYISEYPILALRDKGEKGNIYYKKSKLWFLFF